MFCIWKGIGFCSALFTETATAFLVALLDIGFINIPDMPSELLGKGLGSRRGDRGPNGKLLVGQLNKALYGLRNAPRLWQLHLFVDKPNQCYFP